MLSGSGNEKNGIPWCLSSKESALQCRRLRRPGLYPWVGKIPWRRAEQPTPVFLLEKSHGQRSMVGRRQSDMTKATKHTRNEKTPLIKHTHIHTHANSSSKVNKTMF